MSNHSKHCDQLIEIVQSYPNITEGSWQLRLDLGDTAFRGVRISASSVLPGLKRIKKDKQFRYKIQAEDNTVQINLEPNQNITQDFPISQDWESELWRKKRHHEVTCRLVIRFLKKDLPTSKELAKMLLEDPEAMKWYQENIIPTIEKIEKKRKQFWERERKKFLEKEHKNWIKNRLVISSHLTQTST